MIATIGSGGKTTTLQSIARRQAARAVCVVFTTTKMGVDQLEFADRHLCSFKELREEVEQSTAAFLERNLGKVIAVYDPVSPGQHKIQTTLDEADVQFILQMRSDPVLERKVLFVYEADGSKQLPLKYYVNTDPVFLPGTTKIYACVGFRSLGQPLE